MPDRMLLSRGGSPSHARPGSRILPVLLRIGLMRRTLGPGRTGPVRSLGPARSMAMRQRFPVASSAARTWSTMSRHDSGPSWAQLMRARSIPRSTMLRTRDGSVAASPGSVTMMRVERSSGLGPRKLTAFRASSSPPSGKPAGGAMCPPSGVTSRVRVQINDSMLGSTWASVRPSEDRPYFERRDCRSRMSWRRSSA